MTALVCLNVFLFVLLMVACWQLWSCADYAEKLEQQIEELKDRK